MTELDATHGTVCDLADQHHGYFGWPTVGRFDDGTMIVSASGLRMEHVDPTGRTVILISRDQGETWSSPRVINDSPFDDRDSGVIGLGDQSALVTWFTSDTRPYMEKYDDAYKAKMLPGAIWQTDELAPRFIGAWLKVTDDGGATWSPATRCPVNCPHGPIRLRDGALLYFGKEFSHDSSKFSRGAGDVVALRSEDRGQTWERLGTVPIYPGLHQSCYHEPHVAELPSGKLLGLIRVEKYSADEMPEGVPAYSIIQTESTDAGRTWSPPTPWGFRGAPPHLLVHSSGALVCAWGQRENDNSGECVSISRDEGATWTHGLMLHKGPDWDLGYPSSVELDDGSIFTLYYQKPNRTEDKPALLYTRWRLPE